MTATNATTFDSTAVTVAERPLGVVSIAGRDYQMRCPKMRVWMAMIERMEDYEAAQSLKPHMQEIIRKLAQNPNDNDRSTLIQQYAALQPTYGQAPTALRLADQMLDFLCNCMVDRTDADELRRSYESDDGGCDVPHLRLAMDEMDEVFEDWINEQSDVVGVQRPEVAERPAPTNRQGRRAAARPKKAPAKAGSKRVAAAAG